MTLCHILPERRGWVNMINNSIKQLFVYTHLNDQTVLFQTMQFSISLLCLDFKVHSLNVKQFYLIHRQDPVRCYHSGLEWTWERWQWRGTQHFPKLQHYWNLIIRLLSVISRTLTEGVLSLCREAVGVFYSPSRLGEIGNRKASRRDSMYILLRPNLLWQNQFQSITDAKEIFQRCFNAF